MDVADLADRIDADLRARARPERAAGEKAYLKSDLEHYGVSVPAIRAVVKDAREAHPHLGRNAVAAGRGRLRRAGTHRRGPGDRDRGR